MTVDDALVAFTENQVCRLAGITHRQLRYWAKDLALPTVDQRLSERRWVRLYDFDGVLTVMILAELKRSGLSLQSLRQVVDYIAREGLAFPELVFSIVGSKLHFQRPDGQWQDAHSDQLVIEQTVKLTPLRRRIQAASRRDPATIGRFEKRRGSKGSRQLVAGTRVPVETVRHFLDHGTSLAEVLEAFPVLEPEDVEAVRASA